MDAFFAKNRLSSYLDGTLADAEAAELAAAIEQDPELRREYEAMRRAVELLRRDGPTRAPPGFHARVMAVVDAEPAPGGVVHWLRRSFARVPVEAMALAAAAMVVVVVIQGRSGEVPTLADLPASGPAPTEQAEEGELAKGAPPPPPPTPIRAEVPEAVADTAGAVAAAQRSNTEAFQPSKKSARPQSTTGGTGKAMPGAVYVPDWEQGQVGESTLAASKPKDSAAAALLAYRISLSHARVLYDLSALAEQMGGRMTDVTGRLVAPRALNMEDDFAQLFLVVPSTSSGEVTSRLRKMGAVPVSPPASSPPLEALQTGFAVEVAYMP